MAQEGGEYENGTGAENGSSKGPVFSALRPKLVVEAPKAADAVAFYKAAFGAEEVERSNHPKRKAEQELPLILFSRLRLGAVELLVADETEESGAGAKSVETLGGASFVLCLETDDVEAAVASAVKAGAVAEDVSGEGLCCGSGCWTKVMDPFGFVWAIGSSSKAASVEADGQA
ncbi:Uncharacterized protein EJ110_NYTH38433 [Nymphaea thermarum]|nr:Uncharacterized protein EJ110_NYTH38433 [Nymphaea thermarum]